MNKNISGKLPHFLAGLAFFALVSLSYLVPLPEAAAQTGTNNFDITKGLVGEENIGCDGFSCQLCHVVKAVNNVISFMFYLATVVAVLLFVYAGAKLMMAGGDPSAMTKAKEILWNVIIGAAIMLCAYVVIDTVLKTVLSPEARQYGPWNEVQCITLPPSTTPPGTTPPPTTSTAQERCTREALSDAGINVNKSSCGGRSFQSVSGGCTDVAGLPRQAVEGLIRFKDNCLNCTITVTGGTEDGHRTHGAGRPMIDISSTDADITSYLRAQDRNPVRNPSNGEVTYRIGNDTFVQETNPPHLHIIFGTTENTPYQCAS
ncbi:pilin [Candidatus Parcubacteria bacterium]|nr:pilin [Candidatus Parcubacteria bacterium]